MRNILEDRLSSDSIFSERYDAISYIDEIGFFTRVLLEEYRRLGNLLYGTMEESSFRDETIVFFDFIKRFYLRGPGEDIPLQFESDKIKIGIVLVARNKH